MEIIIVTAARVYCPPQRARVFEAFSEIFLNFLRRIGIGIWGSGFSHLSPELPIKLFFITAPLFASRSPREFSTASHEIPFNNPRFALCCLGPLTDRRTESFEVKIKRENASRAKRVLRIAALRYDLLVVAALYFGFQLNVN